MNKKPSSEYCFAPKLISSNEFSARPQRLQPVDDPTPALVAGEQLSVILERDVCLEPVKAVLIAIEICRMLVPAHKKGIWHGGLSPDMIVVQKTERLHRSVRVLNPGSTTGAWGPAMQYTHSNLLFGKSFFSAPEQPQRADYRTDVFAIGSILHTMLTGVPPQHFSQRKFTAGYEPANHYPNELEVILRRCLKNSPRERYANAEELLLALQASFDAIASSERVMTRKKQSWFNKTLVMADKQFKTNAIPTSIAVAALLVACVGLFKHSGIPHEAVAMQPGKIVYNKDKASFVPGEKVELTVVPPKRSQPMLFYINDQNSVLMFLSDKESATGDKEGPITISSVSGRTLQVDDSKGTLVLVCLNEKEKAKLKRELLGDSAKSDQGGTQSLTISGNQFIERVVSLKHKAPGSISVAIDSAPAASSNSVISQDE